MKRPVLRFRHLLWLARLTGFTWLVVSRFANQSNVAVTLSQGRWDWIACAILLQIAYYGFYARLYQSG